MYVQHSGIDKKWNEREYFGDMMNLLKGSDVSLEDKATIQTKDDLAALFDQYNKDNGINTDKYIGWGVDGAELALASLLSEKYNFGAFEIWGVGHQYGLMAKNGLKDSVFYIKLKEASIAAKSSIDHSNVNKQVFLHFGGVLEVELQQLDKFDPSRFVYTYYHL